MTLSISPPKLPNQWSTGYVSYWQPMRANDEMTSGFCWFDYDNDICRIDGLFNPWPEQVHGHKLWMSEVGCANSGKTVKKRVSYTKDIEQQHYQAESLDNISVPFKELFISQNVLIDFQATYLGEETLLGHEVEGWRYDKAGKGQIRLYFKKGTNHLLRMMTGDPYVHASIRDFPSFSKQKIEPEVFSVI